MQNASTQATPAAGQLVDGWYIDGFEKIKLKKISIKIPVARGFLAHAAGGWNAGSLNDQELLAACKAVHAAHYMQRFSKRFALIGSINQVVAQAANQELYSKVMQECQKREYWKKYEINVSLKPAQNKV